MNITYRNVFLALLAAILIAVPTAAVLQGKNAEIQKSEQNRLLEIKKRDSQIQNLNDQLKQKTDESDSLKKQNDQLQKDLQAKAERKAEEARIAAANAEKQKAAVSVSRVGQAGNCESYRGLVAKYFPADQVNNALLTMSKESSCNPTAVSPTRDHGLMQINEVHLAKVGGNVNALYDPETNIRVASTIFAGRGWNAWYAVRGILW
jgi:soluble lytic murein transglycosylase-like protein